MSHNTKKIHNKKDTFVSAAAISAIGLILTRIISVIYVIPFSAMIQDGALAINSNAYSMFSQFYELSLAGLPLAISRLIAMYNARGEYKTSNRVLKYGQMLMLGLGIILSIAFFFYARPFAEYKMVGNNVNLVEDLVRTMRIIAPSLIILPFMSGMRGYLQGFKTVIGTSISQVVERLVFVIILLVILYFGIYQFNIIPTVAISYAYIALPVASLAALFVLFPFYRNIRKEHKGLMAEEIEHENYPLQTLIKQIITTALPFVIAGFASTMYMSITTLTYENVRVWSGATNELALMEYNALAFYTNKLVAIPLTFSLAMSTSIISFVTSAFEGGDHNGVKNYVNKSYRMIIFSTLGAVILMVLLGKPLLTFFYSYDADTDYIAKILTFDGFRGMFFALETITIALLQSLGKKNRAVLYTAIGPLIKLALTVPLVYFFGVYGEVFSVILGLATVVTLASREIIKITNIKVKMIVNAFIKTLICILPSIIFLLVANFITETFFFNIIAGRITAFFYVAVMGIISLGLFLFTSEKTGFLQLVFGKEFSIKKLLSRFSFRK